MPSRKSSLVGLANSEATVSNSRLLLDILKMVEVCGGFYLDRHPAANMWSQPESRERLDPPPLLAGDLDEVQSTCEVWQKVPQGDWNKAF